MYMIKIYLEVTVCAKAVQRKNNQTLTAAFEFQRFNLTASRIIQTQKVAYQKKNNHNVDQQNIY